MSRGRVSHTSRADIERCESAEVLSASDAEVADGCIGNGPQYTVDEIRPQMSGLETWRARAITDGSVNLSFVFRRAAYVAFVSTSSWESTG